MAKKLKVKNDLKTLKEVWYKKLKADGFEDIEKDEHSLKDWSSRFAIRHSIEEMTAKQIYYRMANHFLNEWEFASILDKVIWEYHTNGISVRDISFSLSKAKIDKTSRQFVWRTVRRLTKAMYAFYKIEDKLRDE